MAPKAPIVPVKTAAAKPTASEPSYRGGKKPPKKPAASNKRAELGSLDEQSAAEPAPPQATAAIPVTAEEKAEIAELQNLFASSVTTKSSVSAPDSMVEAAPAAEGSTPAPEAPLQPVDVKEPDSTHQEAKHVRDESAIREQAERYGVLDCLSAVRSDEPEMLARAVSWMHEVGATDISEVIEEGMIEDFCSALELKPIKRKKLTGMLQRTSGLSRSLEPDPATNTSSRAHDHPPPQRARLWEDEFRGGDIEPVLASGAIALLDASWLVAHAAAGGVLRRRQELPDAAFVSAAALKASCTEASFLPVIALSYPWLTPSHPDPRGDHLQLVSTVLSALLTGSSCRVWGVFWDYGSLFQHGELKPRTTEEDELFKAGLGALGTIYSHPWTWVFRLTRLPSALDIVANTTVYGERGWCFTESSWAQLSKSRFNSLDLGKFSHTQSQWHQIREECTAGGGRRPPLSPTKFNELLATKRFTNGKEDMPLVKDLYDAAFVAHMGSAEELHYDSLQWGDEEAALLSEAIGTGALRSLRNLYLENNSIGDVGAAKLAAVIHLLPSSCTVSVRGNPMSETAKQALTTR